MEFYLWLIAGFHWTPVHTHSDSDLWCFGVHNNRIWMDSNQVILVPVVYVPHTPILHILWNAGCGACAWWQYSSSCIFRFLWLMEHFLRVPYPFTCEFLCIVVTDQLSLCIYSLQFQFREFLSGRGASTGYAPLLGHCMVWVPRYYGFRHEYLGVVAVVTMACAIAFAFFFGLSVKYINFQRRWWGNSWRWSSLRVSLTFLSDGRFCLYNRPLCWYFKILGEPTKG